MTKEEPPCSSQPSVKTELGSTREVHSLSLGFGADGSGAGKSRMGVISSGVVELTKIEYYD